MKFGLVSTRLSSSFCTARSWRKRVTRRSLQVRSGRKFSLFFARGGRLPLAAFLRLQFAHFLAHFLTRFTKSMLPGLVSVAKGHGITSLRCYRICRDAGSSRGPQKKVSCKNSRVVSSGALSAGQEEVTPSNEGVFG